MKKTNRNTISEESMRIFQRFLRKTMKLRLKEGYKSPNMVIALSKPLKDKTEKEQDEYCLKTEKFLETVTTEQQIVDYLKEYGVEIEPE